MLFYTVLISIGCLLMLGTVGKVIRYGIVKLVLGTIAYLSIPLIIIVACFYRG